MGERDESAQGGQDKSRRRGSSIVESNGRNGSLSEIQPREQMRGQTTLISSVSQVLTDPGEYQQFHVFMSQACRKKVVLPSMIHILDRSTISYHLAHAHGIETAWRLPSNSLTNGINSCDRCTLYIALYMRSRVKQESWIHREKALWICCAGRIWLSLCEGNRPEPYRRTL